MEDLKARAKDLFPSIYLTLVSIVQALALQELLSNAFGRTVEATSGLALATHWLQVAGVFGTLLIVWHEYVLGVIRYRYVVGIQDSLIPFVLGVVEFGVIEATFSSGLAAWFVWQAAGLAIGVWIFAHQTQRARGDPENGDVDARQGFFRARPRIAFLAAGALGALTCAVVVGRAALRPHLVLAMVAALGAGQISFGAVSALAWRRMLRV